MGLIDTVFGTIFGNGRNAIVETAQVFRENTEAGAAREAELTEQVLAQFAKEFSTSNRGLFDRVMDGINRIPRPAMAIGTLGLFVAAMVNPIWFAERMQGIALVPEPLWWLLGAIVSFYFGARHQFKGQQFQQSIAATMALAPAVRSNIDTLRGGEAQPGKADTGTDAGLSLQLTEATARENAALAEWREARSR
ncbi:carboxylesterase [Roseovarius faecimaris]|uniref:Carboxylesterase n=1 Tax=Roseovarius faecimaris TaxID=2494550 RepID=A0A6I6IM87_9RHOB|nr:holin family protein [Roseovarius faecimaris]QGX98089.1 carboxylesterase [Roseovarius faecimaris]